MTTTRSAPGPAAEGGSTDASTDAGSTAAGHDGAGGVTGPLARIPRPHWPTGPAGPDRGPSLSPRVIDVAGMRYSLLETAVAVTGRSGYFERKGGETVFVVR